MYLESWQRRRRGNSRFLGRRFIILCSLQRLTLSSCLQILQHKKKLNNLATKIIYQQNFDICVINYLGFVLKTSRDYLRSGYKNVLHGVV